jgi:hypothetical protein
LSVRVEVRSWKGVCHAHTHTGEYEKGAERDLAAGPFSRPARRVLSGLSNSRLHVSGVFEWRSWTQLTASEERHERGARSKGPTYSPFTRPESKGTHKAPYYPNEPSEHVLYTKSDGGSAVAWASDLGLRPLDPDSAYPSARLAPTA